MAVAASVPVGSQGASIGASIGASMLLSRGQEEVVSGRYRRLEAAIEAEEKVGWTTVAVAVGLYIAGIVFSVLANIFPAQPLGIAVGITIASGTCMLPVAAATFRKVARMNSILNH